MGKTRNSYSNEYKVKVVLESMQRDTTIEKVKKQFQLSNSVIHKWRTYFKKHSATVFDGFGKRQKKKRLEEDVGELKKVIGDLTMQNYVLKKVLESLN